MTVKRTPPHISPAFLFGARLRKSWKKYNMEGTETHQKGMFHMHVNHQKQAEWFEFPPVSPFLNSCFKSWSLWNATYVKKKKKKKKTHTKWERNKWLLFNLTAIKKEKLFIVYI